MATPTGVISMWSGSIAQIPTGWALCNGSGGTPDLRGWFVVGASNDFEPGTTTGSATHSHSTVPSLDSGGGHSHGVSITTGNPSGTYNRSSVGGSSPVATGNHTHTLNSTSSVGNHTHAVAAPTSTYTHTPPYYILYYIMKL